MMMEHTGGSRARVKGPYGERGALTYNEGLQTPQRGPRAELLVRSQGTKPLKLNVF